MLINTKLCRYKHEIVYTFFLVLESQAIKINKNKWNSKLQRNSISRDALHFCRYLRSTLGERFVIFGDPVVDGIPVHARREDSRFLVTWTGDVQDLRHFE